MYSKKYLKLHYLHLCLYIGFVADKQPVVLTYAHCVVADSTSSMCLPSLKQLASRWYSAEVLHSPLHLVSVSQPLPLSVYLCGFTRIYRHKPGFDHFHVSIFRQPAWITEIRRGQVHTAIIPHTWSVSQPLQSHGYWWPNRDQICTRI